MAVMYPPQHSDNVGSEAERLLYHEFQAQLDDDYTVMHGVGWLSRKGRRTHDGEADFVIVHPAFGILVLEVKGGTIAGGWSDDWWISTSRTGQQHDIRNPIRQAYHAMYALKLKLEDDPRTSPFHYPMYRAVAFPDMLVEGVEFGPDADRALVLDSSDLAHLEQAVRRAFGGQSGQSLTADAVQAVTDLLQPVIHVTQLGLLAELKQGEMVMARLTEQQFRLLGFLRHHRRVVVNGCAGSGKTMLAIEKTRLLAEQGFRVLLTCFNRNLSEWIRSGIGELEPAIRDRVTVATFHDLAVKLCEEAGTPTTMRAGDSSYWEHDLPAELSAAIPRVDTRFDAIIADEGQDFAASWWKALLDLLDDPAEGVFYVFQDLQQAIYRRDQPMPFAVAPHELATNCRSTAHIHKEVVAYYGGDPKPESLGPEGRGVERIDPGDNLHATIGAILDRLVNHESLETRQVVVLTPNGRNRSRLREGSKAGAFRLTWDKPEHPDQVRVSTPHAFKGLESPVVILAEPERFRKQVHPDELTYVALSRAKHHLILVGELPAPVGTASVAIPPPALHTGT